MAHFRPFPAKAYNCIRLGICNATGNCTARKIGVQAIVNTMGVSVAAAFTAVNRIDDFAYTPEQNIAHAMTALMAQNKGAKRNDRMREGFRCGLVLETIYGILIFIVCFVFARHLMMLFVKDEEVIGHGVTYLHLISIMYILPAITNGLQGFFRGIGDLKITLIEQFCQYGASGFLLPHRLRSLYGDLELKHCHSPTWQAGLGCWWQNYHC